MVTAYRVDGEVTQDVPLESDVLNRAEPVFETLPGWKTDTTGINSPGEIPVQLDDYIRFISDFCKVKIIYVSCGQARDQMVELE